MESLLKRLRSLFQGQDEKAKTCSLADDLDAIAKRCAALPERDRRSADEIIDYDETGVPR